MRPKVFILFAILAVMPLVLSSVATPFPETMRSFSTQTFKPVFQTSDFFSDHITGIFTKGRDLFFAYKQNQELRQRIASLETEVNQLREERKQIAGIEKLLPFLRKNPRTITLAHIIFRGMSFWEHNMVIDKGKKQNIQKNVAIVTHQGLVGRVIMASSSASQVMLLTDYSSKVSVIDQESRDIGLLCGDGRKLLRMTYVDLASTIKVGDTVVTSGMGGIYPKGIPVGKIETVGTDKDGLHLFALVRPFVNFSKVEEVLCLARASGESDYSSWS